MSVSDFAFGTMMLGAMGNTDHDQSVAMIHTALNAGINFVDTADVYSRGESEEIVGRALKGRRSEVVLATKFGLPMSREANQSGGSARWIMQAVEDSLRRLDTDYIDLYQMHRPDYTTDIDDTLATLSELVRSGKVRAIGCSTFPAELIVEAQWTAERRGHHRFRTEQPRYSVLTRTIETAILPTAERYGMGVLSYGPLSGGWLSGRSDPTKSHRATIADRSFNLDKPGNRAKVEIVGQLASLAAEASISLTQLATAFVRAHPAVTSVIIGPRTPEQLDDLLTGADVELDGDVLDRIDEIVAPGTELNAADNYYAVPPSIEDKIQRRR
jgi:aryl-alcohol dehydrogenase-like predicted oxidoreductase